MGLHVAANVTSRGIRRALLLLLMMMMECCMSIGYFLRGAGASSEAVVQRGNRGWGLLVVLRVASSARPRCCEEG